MDNNYYNAPIPQKNGLCTAALVLGIASFFVDPMYLVSLTGLILGIVGITRKPTPTNKSCGVWGIILSSCGFVVQLILDILLSVFSAGIGAFSFFC
jgi:energy-converting hydrogenase Eha subunit C